MIPAAIKKVRSILQFNTARDYYCDLGSHSFKSITNHTNNYIFNAVWFSKYLAKTISLPLLQNGHQNATSSTSLISEDNQTKNKNCFRLSKRPALHQYGDYRDTSTSFSTIRETDSFKSLNNVNEMSYTDNDHVNNHLKVAKNVFVFGSDDNKNGGFFGNFFRGIGNSVKTMFGFK